MKFGIILICLLFAVCGFFYFFTEDKTVTGVVIEHNTTSSRNGTIGYYTLVKYDDGCIRSECGLSYYIVPIGGTVKKTYKIIK